MYLKIERSIIDSHNASRNADKKTGGILYMCIDCYAETRFMMPVWSRIYFNFQTSYAILKAE